MNKLKYIVIGETSLFMFPMHVNHIDMYQRVRRVLKFDHVDALDCTSAGFVRFSVKDEQVIGECYGRSESLNIESNPDMDNFLLDMMV